MSPLLDLQQRGRELGRIRIGTTVVTANGKRRPEKLDAFRFTTPSESKAHAVADLFGGEVRRWEPERGAGGWEVVTSATELPVVIPVGQPLTQWWELWSGAGCLRRCDGVVETLSAKPCVCPPAGPERSELASAGGACKPTSRLSVMLPDLPDLGVWVLASHGYYAAVELGATAELLHRASEAGVPVPAHLRLEQREQRRPGKPVQSYAVPVLELRNTARELLSGSVAALPEAPTPVRAALTAGPSEDAQALADHATDARTRGDVVVLGERASVAGLLDAPVTAPDGSRRDLRSVLLSRHEELPE